MSPIPITLVTGFLGAGKSTFINRIIAENPRVRYGIIVNEFGDVALESEIIEADEDAILELSNGCMCCVVRTDLIKAVEALLDESNRIEHILVEASGLSDPVRIAQTFIENSAEGRVSFDSILCLVDVENFLETEAHWYIVSSQLNYADFVLLTKTADATPDTIDAVVAHIRDTTHRAEIVRLDGDVPLALLLESGCSRGADGYDATKHAEPHADDVVSVFFSENRCFENAVFDEVFREFSGRVFRAKGYFAVPDGAWREFKHIFQYVGSRRELKRKPWDADEQRRSAGLFIGRNFDPDELTKRLMAASLPITMTP